MTSEKITQIVTLIGIFLSFIVGAAALFIGINNSRKTIFINSITSARIQYIQKIRESISEFCGLVYAYHANALKTGSTEALEIQKRYDNLKYLIQLHFNVMDEYFDPEILRMINEIRNIQDGSNLSIVEGKIEPLILIMQYLLKLEWEGVKKESEKGMISKKEKHNLYTKYVNLYKENISNLKKMKKEPNIIGVLGTCIFVLAGLISIGWGIGKLLSKQQECILISGGIGFVIVAIILGKIYFFDSDN